MPRDAAGQKSRAREEPFERSGYRVIPSVLDAHAITRVRARVDALVDGLAAPGLFAASNQPLGSAAEGAMVTPTGLALTRLLRLAPELASDVVVTPLATEAGALCRALLGASVRVEGVGATISDAARPFFPWHTHIDGLDEGERVRRRVWRPVTRIERLLTLLYLQDVDEQHGVLLVRPRAVGDPTAPPGDLDEPAWPDRVVVCAPAGSLVVLDQCTWHAAQPIRGEGRRMVIASSFAREDAKAAPWTDPSIAGFSAMIAART